MPRDTRRGRPPAPGRLLQLEPLEDRVLLNAADLMKWPTARESTTTTPPALVSQPAGDGDSSPGYADVQGSAASLSNQDSQMAWKSAASTAEGNDLAEYASQMARSLATYAQRMVTAREAAEYAATAQAARSAAIVPAVEAALQGQVVVATRSPEPHVPEGQPASNAIPAPPVPPAVVAAPLAVQSPHVPEPAPASPQFPLPPAPAALPESEPPPTIAELPATHTQPELTPLDTDSREGKFLLLPFDLPALQPVDWEQAARRLFRTLEELDPVAGDSESFWLRLSFWGVAVTTTAVLFELLRQQARRERAEDLALLLWATRDRPARL